MDKFLRKLIEYRAIMLFSLVVISVYGLYCYYTIPKQENPDAAVPIAVISTVYPGASPEDVEFFVTEKLEQRLSTLEKIDSIESYSINSASVVIVKYQMDVYIQDVVYDLRTAVEGVQSELPDLCKQSVLDINLIQKNQFILSLSGDKYSSEDLTEYALNIKEELIKVQNVTSISVFGSKEKEIVVEVDVDSLNLYGISIENVLSVLQAQNLTIPSGSIGYEQGKINVITPSIFTNTADIENTVVGGAKDSLGFVRIKDIAQVKSQYKDKYYFEQDGQNAVLLTGTFKDGQNPVNIGKDLRKSINEVKHNLPQGLTFHEVFFSPEDVDKSINGFIISLLQSIALIVVVVMVGVHLRNGLVISVAIPLTILITFIVMSLLEIQFHFISIAALIISLGILVDNAIVISEAIQHGLNTGLERTVAVVTGVQQTAVPMFTSTLTTVVTFSIIYFIPGAIGKIAGTIPSVVIASLVASYAIAMLVTPVLAYMFFKPEHSGKTEKVSFFKRIFIAALKYGLNHRLIVLLLAVSTLGISIMLVTTLGVKFFPFANKPVVYIDITAESLSLGKTEKLTKEVYSVLEQSPLVQNYAAGVGIGLPSFFITVSSPSAAENVAQVMLQLNPDEVSKYDGIEDVARELQTQLDGVAVGGSVMVKCLEYSMPTPAKIALSVSGDDVFVINEGANLLREKLAQTNGTENVRDTAIAPEFVYEVQLDSELLSTYGLLKYDVVKQLNTAIMGAKASSLISGGKQIDILLKTNIDSLDTLYTMPIMSSMSNQKVLLRDIAKIQLSPTMPQIRRYNEKRYVNVLSGVLPGYSAASIEAEALEAVVPTLTEMGLTVDARGETSNMSDLIGNIGVSGAGAVAVIFIILLLQFKSFKKPAIIITSIPLSLIGCCFGLYILKMDIQAMALLGLVSLFGIVVNNGIILVEFMDYEQECGHSIYDACINAVSLRFRPIMLSSITTCVGLIPLILANDPMSAPMATVLLFGLLFSTVLTIVVVPVIYSGIKS